jgi:uncharacterized protein
MKIIIDDLTSEPLHLAEEIPKETYSGEFELLENVRFDIQIFKSGIKVKISGHVSASVALTCSRCLKKFPFRIETSHTLQYQPSFDMDEEENVRLRKDELSIIYYTEPVINLYEDIRQTILLAIPLKPVCSENCRGICPSCGANLNFEKCSCGAHAYNPQFEKLKQLKELKERE